LKDGLRDQIYTQKNLVWSFIEIRHHIVTNYIRILWICHYISYYHFERWTRDAGIPCNS